MRGTVLGGRYELRSVLGSGGAAEVWEAHDRLLERTVAVKLPYAGSSADAARARAHARFRRAAVLGAQLSGHPHIVPVHDYGHHPGPGPDGADGGREGVPYLMLEHVPGPSLAELIGRPPVVPVARALEWAGQICDALTAVHEAGVVHRDLSPDNVLLSHPYPDLGSALLTDFGLAVRCPDGRSAPAPALLTGTPAYLAPEQARPGARTDGRSDLYALGCLLYALLTGRPPSAADSAPRRRDDSRAGSTDTAGPPTSAPARTRPGPPGRFRAGVPRAVDAFVLHLLAEDPADRPPHARAARDRLSALCRGLPGPPPRLPQTELHAVEERAYTLVEQEDHTAAVPLLERVIGEYVRDPGPEHPGTLGVRHVHAYALAAAGRHTAAARAHRRLARDRARALGPEHPETLASRHHHAYNLGESGRCAEAAALFRSLAEDRARLLGATHPGTLSARHSHAVNLAGAGSRVEAAQLLAAVAEDRAHVLGAGHPDTLLSRHDHACALGESGRPDHAARLLSTVAEDAARLLGTDHPSTVSARRSWNGFRTAARRQEREPPG